MLYPVIHIIIYPTNYISPAAIVPAPPPPPLPLPLPPMMEEDNKDSK